MRVLAALLLVLVAGCVEDIYHPASNSYDSGWRESEIETGRWRITFTGASSTDVGQVQDLCLLRAAELALSKGAAWFTVVSSATVEQELGTSTAYVGGASFGRRRFGGDWLMIDEMDRGRMVATLEIILGKGTKPTGDPHVYDAQDVVNTIGPRVHPPAKPQS